MKSPGRFATAGADGCANAPPSVLRILRRERVIAGGDGVLAAELAVASLGGHFPASGVGAVLLRCLLGLPEDLRTVDHDHLAEKITGDGRVAVVRLRTTAWCRHKPAPWFASEPQPSIRLCLPAEASTPIARSRGFSRKREVKIARSKAA